jgi:hypothetical protein
MFSARLLPRGHVGLECYQVNGCISCTRSRILPCGCCLPRWWIRGLRGGFCRIRRADSGLARNTVAASEQPMHWVCSMLNCRLSSHCACNFMRSLLLPLPSKPLCQEECHLDSLLPGWPSSISPTATAAHCCIRYTTTILRQCQKSQHLFRCRLPTIGLRYLSSLWKGSLLNGWRISDRALPHISDVLGTGAR